MRSGVDEHDVLGRLPVLPPLHNDDDPVPACLTGANRTVPIAELRANFAERRTQSLWVTRQNRAKIDDDDHGRLEAKLERLTEAQERAEETRARLIRAKMHAGRVHERRTAMWARLVGACHAHEAMERFLALMRLRQLFLPLWRRYWRVKKKRSARIIYTALRLPRLERVTVAKMKAAGALFREWPDSLLERLVGKMRPVCYRAGEVIAHQGDRGVYMYFLIAGNVDVVVKGRTKGRSLRSGGLKVFTLTP